MARRPQEQQGGARSCLSDCSLGQPSSFASSQMNCGSALVKLGDGKTEVLAKCGEPDYREVVSGDNDSKREDLGIPVR